MTSPTGSLSYLRGKRIVITRATEQGLVSGRMLAARGGVPIYLPLIQITPPADPSLLDEALRSAHTYAWIVFTSANAVRAVATRVTEIGLTPAARGRSALAAIGPATAQALTERGLKATLLAEQADAEALATSLVAALGPVRGQRVLVPQADRAAPDLVQALTAAGAQVTSVTAYHTRLAPPAAEAQRALAGGVDAVTFASPSAAEGWASFGLPTPPLTACIGPTTAAAAQATGLTVDVVAPHPHTWVALLEALEQYWTPAKDLP